MRKPVHKAARFLAAAIAGGVAFGFPGCAGTVAPSRPPSPFGPAPSTNHLAPEPRQQGSQQLYAVFGQALIAPPAALEITGRPPPAKLDDGRDVPIILHRGSISFWETSQPFGSPESVALRWIGPISVWNDAPASVELCEVQLPPDAIGNWLWLGSRHVDLTWIPAEKPVKVELGSLAAEAKSDRFVLACLRAEGASPWMRWRSALFGIAPASAGAVPIPFDPNADPHEALPARPAPPSLSDQLAARQNALWNHVLARLAKADADVFRRVINECTRVVRFDSGPVRFAPAWADAASCQLLLDQLLLNRDDARRLVAAASEWLSQQPVACAWVSDDAGLLDAESRMPLPRLGAANFSPSPVLSWASGAGDARTPELITIQPDRAQILAIPSLAADQASAAEVQAAEVHVGNWATKLPVDRAALVARPPGLLIAPSFLDSASNTWMRSQSLSPLPTGERSQIGALAARIVREAGPTNVPSGSGWSMYFELERSVHEQQTVRLWFGPSNRATLIVEVVLPETSRIPESGDPIVMSHEPGGRDQPLAGAQVIGSATHWSLRIPIPNRAVERPGLIRLGVEHIRGNFRSSWPRAMFPWANEPARALVDLTRW